MSYEAWGEPLDYDEPDYERDLDIFDREDQAWGCAFGERCCMPSPHTVDECHTPEMAEEYMREALEG